MPVKKPSRLQAFIGPRSVILAFLSIAALGVLIVACQPSPVDVSAAAVQPHAATTAAPLPEKATPKPRLQAKPAAPRTAALETPARSTTTATSAPAVLPASRAAAADTVSKAVVQDAEPVTITGCVVRDHETFRLKETEGEDAPKSRSWKSGFLKRGSASIELVDAADRLKLATHVGERVTVTGMLVEREMQARSLRRVGESCD